MLHLPGLFTRKFVLQIISTEETNDDGYENIPF